MNELRIRVGDARGVALPVVGVTDGRCGSVRDGGEPASRVVTVAGRSGAVRHCRATAVHVVGLGDVRCHAVGIVGGNVAVGGVIAVDGGASSGVHLAGLVSGEVIGIAGGVASWAG